MSPRRPLLPPRTEETFQQSVLDLARVLGWRSYHTRDSRRSVPGFPDLVLLKGPRMIVAELKSPRGVVTADQEVWLDAFRSVPCAEVYVWRPADMQGIVSLLTRRADRTQSASASRNHEASRA